MKNDVDATRTFASAAPLAVSGVGACGGAATDLAAAVSPSPRLPVWALRSDTSAAASAVAGACGTGASALTALTSVSGGAAVGTGGAGSAVAVASPGR